MIGPGKYDRSCTIALGATGARAVALAVIDGDAGSGFSVLGEPQALRMLPALLRKMAREIQNDLDHPTDGNK